MRASLLPGPAALLALFVGLVLGLSPLKHFDLFFHLAGGQWVLEHGFTRVDPFSLTGTAGWVPHEWGFGVMSTLLVRWLGAAGPALLIGALVAANILLLWTALGRATERRGLLALLVLGAILFVQSPTWSEERPFHLGHLLFTLAVLGVQAWRAGNQRILWLFPFLGAAWANLHGSWLLGPALLASSAMGAALDEPAWRRRAAWALASALGMFLAAGLSADGLDIYLYPIHHSILQSTQNLNEWQPLSMGPGWSWAYLGLLGGMLFLLGGSPSRRIAILLPTLGLALAALKVHRHAPFAVVLVGLALLEHSAHARLASWPELPRRALARLDDALSGWSARARGALWPALALGLLVLVNARDPQPLAPGRVHPGVPVACAEALKKLPPGKVMNRFIFGGVISYFAGPDYKVFIDPRNDPFPQSVHDDYGRILWGEPGWEEAFARYAPDYILWDTENPGNILLDHLKLRGGWREVLRDRDVVLWAREQAPAPALQAGDTSG